MEPVCSRFCPIQLAKGLILESRGGNLLHYLMGGAIFVTPVRACRQARLKNQGTQFPFWGMDRGEYPELDGLWSILSMPRTTLKRL